MTTRRPRNGEHVTTHDLTHLQRMAEYDEDFESNAARAELAGALELARRRIAELEQELATARHSLAVSYAQIAILQQTMQRAIRKTWA